MSSESTSTVQATPQTGTFTFEYPVLMNTGDKRWSKQLATIPQIKDLCKMFASVTVTELEVEVAQITLIGTTKVHLNPGGICFVGIIPTGQDTEIASGTNASTILNVPRKSALTLSTTDQMVKVFSFSLSGYETDLGQDPRRKQGPVLWFGNTGVSTYAGTDYLPLCAMTWRGKVLCTGTSTLW